MSFRLSVRRSYYTPLIEIGAAGFSVVAAGLLSMKTAGMPSAALAVAIGLVAAAYAGVNLFFHHVQLYPDCMILSFGIFYLHRKIYYRDIARFRFADKNDAIPNGQPAWGDLSDTIAITFTNGELLFLSVQNASAFCEKLERRCKQVSFSTNP